ncbi:MAG: hypothetical protein ACJ8MO_29435 [Bacillus sp. (in: firmicutes)]
MTVNEISQLISQVGFPIFVAGFMLIKQAKDTENMVNILTKLQATIDNLANKIDGK